MTNEERQDLVKYRLEQSEDAARDAFLLLENKSLGGTINRIYYSMFYTVSSLAIQERFLTSKHKQLLGWFNKNYIYEGIVSPIYKDMIRTAFDYRTQSDYGKPKEFTFDEVEQLYKNMVEFNKVVGELIDK